MEIEIFSCAQTMITSRNGVGPESPVYLWVLCNPGWSDWTLSGHISSYHLPMFKHDHVYFFVMYTIFWNSVVLILERCILNCTLKMLEDLFIQIWFSHGCWLEQSIDSFAWTILENPRTICTIIWNTAYYSNVNLSHIVCQDLFSICHDHVLTAGGRLQVYTFVFKESKLLMIHKYIYLYTNICQGTVSIH